MARKRHESIFTEVQKKKLAEFAARARQMREDYAAADKEQVFHFSPAVAKEYCILALWVLPMVLKAAGEAPIEVRERGERTEDELLGAMEG